MKGSTYPYELPDAGDIGGTGRWIAQKVYAHVESCGGPQSTKFDQVLGFAIELSFFFSLRCSLIIRKAIRYLGWRQGVAQVRHHQTCFEGAFL